MNISMTNKKNSHESHRDNAETDALFFSIGEGAIVTDEKGNVSRINDVALQILNLTAEEIIGKWYPGVVVAEDKDGNVIPNMERPITEVFLAGKPIFRRVYYRIKGGSSIPVALTVSPVMINGNPAGAIEVFRDISEEVELEKAKDEFISIASHQLRTPATVVKQYLGMMLEGYMGDLSKSQKEMLETAYEYNDHQLDVVNDLLKVAQADANQVRVLQKNVDILDLIKDVIEGQKAEYKKDKVELNLEQPDEDTRCKADPLHIRMILDNLIDNARKYSSPGSKVTVTVIPTALSVKVSVIDQGIGIAEKDIPKLFQKFSRIDNPLTTVGGTGLGLYWAKKLIQLHNGNICVESVPDEGTTFTLELPRGNF